MTQKSILITGCSSGIGYDAAHTLAKRGWRVLATCRKPEDVARLQAEGLESYALDLASDDSVAAGADEALSRTGGTLDALFNNGAFALPGLAEDLPRDGLRAIYETNLFGQFDLTNRLIPAMKQQGHGRIVFNSSVLGFVGLRFRAAYVGTKFAMEGMVDVMRMENHHQPIDLVLIEPGPIGTKIRQNAIPQFEKWIDWKNSLGRKFYEEVAMPRLYDTSGKKDRFELPCSAVTDKLIHALESPRPRPRYYVTTPTYVMGICRRLLGTRALDWIARQG